MKRRNKYYNFEQFTIDIDLGNWTMLMVFAKSVDFEKFKIFYSLNTNLFNPSFEENDIIPFDEYIYSSSVDFINDIIISLKNEDQLFIKYPEKKLIEITDNDKEINYPFIYENNNLFTDNYFLINFLKQIRDEILIKCLLSKKPFLTYIM